MQYYVYSIIYIYICIAIRYTYMNMIKYMLHCPQSHPGPPRRWFFAASFCATRGDDFFCSHRRLQRQPLGNADQTGDGNGFGHGIYTWQIIIHIYIYTYIHICIHIHIHENVCIYIYIYICTHIVWMINEWICRNPQNAPEMRPSMKLGCLVPLVVGSVHARQGCESWRTSWECESSRLGPSVLASNLTCTSGSNQTWTLDHTSLHAYATHFFKVNSQFGSIWLSSSSRNMQIFKNCPCFSPECYSTDRAFYFWREHFMLHSQAMTRHWLKRQR